MTDSAFARIENQFVIPVLRQNDTEVLVQMSRALAKGGLPVIEITLMNEESREAIKRLATDPHCFVGAGTVRTIAQAETAYEDGAKFLVSPGFDEQIAQFCKKNGVAFIPGVMTPSEIQRASNFGLKVLKVFPAQALGGPSYLKHLSGPFPDLKWMATGGVSSADVPDYWKAKAFAVGLGSQLFPPGSVENRRWAEIETAVREFTNALTEFKSQG